MKTLREYIDLIESATAPIVVPKSYRAPKKELKYTGPSASEYRGPASPQEPEKKIPVLQRLKPMDPNSDEYKAWYKANYTDKGLSENWINHDAPEPLAKHFAELYYNGLSPADEAKMAAHIYQQVVDGELSIDQLKKNIAALEKRS